MQVWEACRGQGGGRLQNEDMGSGVSRDRCFRVSEEATGRRVGGGGHRDLTQDSCRGVWAIACAKLH